jgi:ribosome-binding factor A
MQHRPDRVAHELKNEISVIIARELHDPRVGLATVTDAKVSPDLRHARVYVSVYGPPEEQQETLAALNHAAGFIRRAIGSRLRLRRSPEIVFTFDESVEYGDRMERLIAEVNQENPGFESQPSDQRRDDDSTPEV